MRFLVFADGQGLGDFAGQRLVGELRVRFALLHELDGEREAEHARDERETAHLAALGQQAAPGVTLPYLCMVRFFVGYAQQRGAVRLVFRVFGDAAIHFRFRDLVLLENEDLLERGVRKLRGRHGACVCGRRRGASGCTVGGAFGGGGVFAGRVVGRSWFVGGGRGAVRRGVHVGFGRGRL